MVTVKFVAVVELIVMLPGREHVAAAGAPLQVRVAVPLTPCPPIDSAKEAVPPAATLAVAGAVPAILNPRPGAAPVPFSDIV